MSRVFVLLLLGIQLCCAESQYPRYIRFPVGTDPETECLDNQIHKRFKIGEVWSSRNSDCKQSHCIREDGVLYIDRFQCPAVSDNIDFKKLKASNFFCRQTSGDRRKSFPNCCPRLVCKHYVDGKLVPLPAHKYPFL